jgi:hypothetical protein
VRGGDLIEDAQLAPRGLAVMLAALAIGEAVEYLVLPGGGRELGVAIGDLELALRQLASTQAALRFDAFEEGLASQQIGCANRARLADDGSLLLSRVLQVDIRRPQFGLGARVPRDGLSQLLLGKPLFALA